MRVFYYIHYWKLILLFSCSSIGGSDTHQSPKTSYKGILESKNRTVSAFLVFGDSTVDTGNNNYLATIVRSDFPPYGMDFKDHEPTGRFSDGRLSPDIIASYLGIKDYMPPYLNPHLSIEDFITGVSFATSGCGYDPTTGAIWNVKSVDYQMEYLKEYKAKLEGWMGKEEAENHMKKAVAFVSCAVNDFVGKSLRWGTKYDFLKYERFILDKIKKLIQSLWDEGLRTIALTGLPPTGCLPLVITLFSKDRFRQRDCVEDFNFIARDYNLKLQKELKSIKSQYKDTQIFYVDIYTPLHDMIQGNLRSNFRRADVGCCGSGYLEVSVFCNPFSYICPNASEYVFFDSLHPTEKTYSYIIDANRDIINKILKG